MMKTVTMMDYWGFKLCPVIVRTLILDPWVHMRRRHQYETMVARCDRARSPETVDDRNLQLAARPCQAVLVCRRSFLKQRLFTPVPETGVEITARHLLLESFPVQAIHLNPSLTLAGDRSDQIVAGTMFQALIS
jgi:hypothetical protein